ncbi:carboxylesterase family protein [Paratractidigestivibacter sp.]|uniref:carboxylesterase family protein n=1 Tax=Paratractidigestivibacter sp. TaxID=2847316 RepID=UPI002AC99378|nr:carboxylesterase family protein [Paratractidigestivibacter sp.]
MMNANVTRRNFLTLSSLVALGLAGCSTSQSSGSAAKSSAKALEGAEVETTLGKVTGKELGDDVITWYGIPYGKSPVDDLRWKAPEAAEAWSETRDCTAPVEKAIQLSSGEVVGTEDCLNLTVTSKVGHAGKPVLVFVHGGNNQTGTSAEIVGDQLVSNADCVYVSLNYRLGLLGFNCLPSLVKEEGASGNFGMLDIAAALDWVKENAAAFGGDPENITISGFSAGGRDVMAMLISPYFEGKFQKAVVYSGGMTTCDTAIAQTRIAKALAPLAIEDGKAADEDAAVTWLLKDADEVKTYLLSIDSKRLVPLMANANIRMAVFPHLFEDDVVVPKGGFNGAKYYSVPTIMLTGSSEFSMFSLGDSWWKGEEATALGNEVLAAASNFSVKYGSDMYRIFNAQVSADTMASSFDKNIYVCQVNYGGDDSAMGADLQPYGSFHGIFVPMLAKENNYSAMMPGVFDKAGYQAMGEAYNAYLKNFLASGDPNGDGLSAWNAWDKSSKQSLVLDATETEAKISCEDVSRSYGDIIADMETDTTISSDVKKAVAKNVLNGRWFSAAVDEYYCGNWM